MPLLQKSPFGIAIPKYISLIAWLAISVYWFMVLSDKFHFPFHTVSSVRTETMYASLTILPPETNAMPNTQ